MSDRYKSGSMKKFAGAGYEPETRWATAVRECEAEMASLQARLRELEELRRAGALLRCPGRDSAGARCTGDVGHGDGHRVRSNTDLPRPHKAGRWVHIADPWDVR